MHQHGRRIHLFLPVLIACASISFFMPTFVQSAPLLSGPWEYTGPMNAKRAFHTLSLLPDGTALAAGGFYQENGDHYLQTSETYDLLSNSWTPAGVMTAPRSRHTATVLLDGRVLVVGGKNGTVSLNTAEVYNPGTRTWASAGTLATARYGHTATRLLDGRVLVVGGCSGALSYTRTAEIYNPATGGWTSAGSLPAGARFNHTAVLLAYGEVLVSGGDLPVGTSHAIYDTAYRYNPNGNTWSSAGTMTSGRTEHNAVLRRDDKVMAVGGYQKSPANEIVYLGSSEAYDPAANSWTNLNKAINYPRATMMGVLDALGNYILIGGDNGTAAQHIIYRDIHDPSDNWHELSFDHFLKTARKSAAAVQLPGGKILVAGGLDEQSSALNTAEIIPVRTGSPDAITPSNNALEGLFLSSATMLPNGDIMIIGGADEHSPSVGGSCHNRVHVWLHDLEAMDDRTPYLNDSRCGQAATLLGDGRVVVIGGAANTLLPSGSPGEILSDGQWTRLTGPAFISPKTVLLPNGEILVLDPTLRPRAYLFNPADLSFRRTAGDYTGTYTDVTLTLMKTGKVLILGSSTSLSVEIYDPLTGTFSTAAPLSKKIIGHTATLLPDGRVIIAGGQEVGNPPLREVHLYDPLGNTWNATGSLMVGRRNHSAVLLPDGRPVILGGEGATEAIGSVEIYDRATGTWSAAGDLTVPRHRHDTLLTLKGKLLTFGGIDRFDDPYRTAEQFTPANISSEQRLWKPTVTGAACANCTGDKRLELGGSGFTGGGEASGGSTAQSPANHPLVQIMRLDNLQMEWLYPEGASVDTHFLSKPFPDFPSGPAMVWVYVNGSFQGKVALFNGNNFNLFLPLLLR
jgi:N-acetylneuraminic acid mutarotase